MQAPQPAVSVVGQRALGKGTYGSVTAHRVSDGTASVDVAVKVSTLGSDDDDESVFVHEATAHALVGSVSSRAFPRFYGAMIEASTRRAAIAMECVTDATSLGQSAPPATPAAARALLFELLHALATVQIRDGLRHGDVSWNNILIVPAVDTTLRCHLAGPRPAASAKRLRDGSAVHQPPRPAWTLTFHCETQGGCRPVIIDYGSTAWRAKCTDAGPGVYVRRENLATLPAPEMLFWPTRVSNSLASDTFALGLLFFLHLGQLVPGRVFERSPARDAVRGRIFAEFTGIYGTILRQESDALYEIMLVQTALGRGALPSSTEVPHGQSALLDYWRCAGLARVVATGAAACGDTARYAAAAARIERVYGRECIQLLRALLAWDERERSVPHGRPVHEVVEPNAYAPAFHALQHAYFDALRVPPGAPEELTGTTFCFWSVAFPSPESRSVVRWPRHRRRLERLLARDPPPYASLDAFVTAIGASLLSNKTGHDYVSIAAATAALQFDDARLTSPSSSSDVAIT